jgi:hypothetical protein
MTKEDRAKRREYIKDAYRDVFGSDKGKEVLADLCNFVNLGYASYGNDVNVNDMIFAEGERNVCMYVLKNVGARIVDQLNDLGRFESKK